MTADVAYPELPTDGDLLPERWWDDLVIPWREYDARTVPAELVATVNDDDSHRLLCIGEHPDHGLFLLEVLDNGNSPPYFVGWWKVLRATMAPGAPIAVLDDHLWQILARPGMSAPNIVALESVLWALLTYRARIHPRPRHGLCVGIVRELYREHKARLGIEGPMIASIHFQEEHPDATPEDVPEALRFYKEWTGLVIHRQDQMPAAAVHILERGVALCEFILGVPGDWPPGHKWVDAGGSSDATCAGCTERLNSGHEKGAGSGK